MTRIFCQPNSCSTWSNDVVLFYVGGSRLWFFFFRSPRDAASEVERALALTFVYVGY